MTREQLILIGFAWNKSFAEIQNGVSVPVFHTYSVDAD